MTLETIVGPLEKTIHQVDLATVQTASQITTARRDNLKLRKNWFWTADSAIYRVEDGEVVLYLGNADTNLIFRNPVEALKQLRETGGYRPSKEDIESVVDAKTVTRFQFSDLDLRIEDKYFANFDAYFEINTSNYDKLNSTQRAFAEQVYGAGEDFVKNMKLIKNSGSQSVRAYVLNPTYVKQNTTEDKSLSLPACTSALDGSLFMAVGKDVNYPYFALRGVPTAKNDK